MTIPLTGAGSVSRFTPKQLPSLGPTMIAALGQRQGLLFQNAGKTTPAVANNDPVRVASDSFNAGTDLTAPSDGQRPLLQTSGGKWWFQYDGIDDGFALATRLSGFPVSLFFAGRPTSLAGNPTAIGPEGNGFAEYRVSASGKQTLFAATIAGGVDANTISVAGVDHVWGVTYDGATVAYYLDGLADGGGAFNGIGVNNGAKGFGFHTDSSNEIWVGRLYGIVTTTAILSAADIAKLTNYMKGLYQ